jgi:hypothetical protein
VPETWYRGEAIDVKPASPGSTPPHDLGDGMYLTDSEASARAYAQLRSSGPVNQRVYSVKIDRSSLRVLDLTTDPRWQQHVKPVEQYIKQANENYGRTFESFIKTHKINLSQYDAVIGPDYVRGGKQMCLLFKNGQPTRLHIMIRKTFQSLTPVTTRVRSWLPKINIKARSVRMVAGIKAAGPILIEFSITILLSLLQAWLERKMMRQKIEEGLKELEPKINDQLDKLKPNIAKLQLRLDKGEKVFANVTIEVHYIPMSLGPGRASYTEPKVRLADIQIGSKAVNAERSFERTENEGNFPRVRRQIDQSTHAFEVQVLSDEELELFRDLAAEYLSYKRKLAIAPTNQVFIEEARRLRTMILQTYGEDVWFLESEQLSM